MDSRLLRHYNQELQYLREMGAEFAQQFPRVAGRLGMAGTDVADPFVERLLEGVSFLAARVHVKLEAEFPQFTQAILERVHPHVLAPTPSMLVAQFAPDLTNPNLTAGPSIPRNTSLTGPVGGSDVTVCEFRTAHEVRLWPIELVSASYFSYAPDLPLTMVPVNRRIAGGLRLRLKAAPGRRFSELGIDRLVPYFGGSSDVANKLYELCAGSALGVLVVPVRTSGDAITRGPRATAVYTGAPHNGPPEFVQASAIRPVGFDDEEALLPVAGPGFRGYRLLQEYFAFPERYRFLEFGGLQRAMSRACTGEIEVVILFERADPGLERLVDTSNVSLFCVPAVNLFPKRTDRIHVRDSEFEYHVIADRTRPLDFEVYGVSRVIGHGSGSDQEQTFRPFYTAPAGAGQQREPAYFVTRREPRLVGTREARNGSRSSYLGTEVFLSLVDPVHAPFDRSLRQLAVETMCTNRDLAQRIPRGHSTSDLSPDIAVPITAVRIVDGPSPPQAPLVSGATAWSAINHLSLNYLSLAAERESRHDPSALRELLGLYVPESSAAGRRQVEGIASVHAQHVVRKLPRVAGPLAFGRGLQITIDVEDLAFEGDSAFLFGAVLSRFLARHASVNSFTETVLRSNGRGEIGRWLPTWGARPTV